MEEIEKQKVKDGIKIKQEYRRSILLFLRFSAWIAGPVVIAAFLGNWFDKKYQTSPWIFLTAIGISFIFSMIGLIKETIKEYKKIERENSEKNKDKEENK